MNKSEKVESLGEAEKSEVPPVTDDTDFELTADMMIHDFDDETTLNEEEDDIETNEEELEDLAKEGEMPLEELYAMYYGRQSNYNADDEAADENVDKGSSNGEQNSDDAPKRNLRSMSSVTNPTVASGSDSSDEERNQLRLDDRKKPRVGEDYQVTDIPELLEGRPYEYKHADQQVWAPWKLPEESVTEFMKEIALSVTTLSRAEANSASFIQDNEDALHLLTQCNNDIEEALRQFKARPPPLSNEIQVWSEVECQQFEDGLSAYGKEFYLIHVNKLRTKSVRDIVKFYYIWKKSERYDHFAAKTRFGKKKELLPANVTDYMDRLLDETDHASTSSLLNYNGGSRLRYPIMAHSAALMEHLRQVEASSTGKKDSESSSEGTHEFVDVTTNPVGASSVEILQSALPTHVNNSNNKEDELLLSDSDICQVINDLTQSSSGFG